MIIPPWTHCTSDPPAQNNLKMSATRNTRSAIVNISKPATRSSNQLGNALDMKAPSAKSRGRKPRSTSVDKKKDHPEDISYFTSVMGSSSPVRRARSCDSSEPKSIEESHDPIYHDLDSPVRLENRTVLGEIGESCSGINGQHPSPFPNGSGTITPPPSSNKFSFSRSGNVHSPDLNLHLSESGSSNGARDGSIDGGCESDDERSSLVLQRVESSSSSNSRLNISGFMPQ